MRTRTRWLVPAAVTAVLVGGPLALPQLATADPELPPTTAEELLTDLAATEEQPSFAGTAVHTSDLGLPEIPEGGHSTSELSTLLTGDTTARVWSDGPHRSRVSMLGELAETTIIRNGSDLWAWRSDTGTVAHAALPAHTTVDDTSLTVSPQDVAARVLALLEPTTEVTVDGTARVAGRDTYELVLTPRDPDTLVGQVRLAVDAATNLPLRVQVLAEGASEPALETAFTAVDLTAPDPTVFAFTPPEGAAVTEFPLLAGEHDADESSVVGEGWSSVLVTHGSGLSGLTGTDDDAAETLLNAFRPVTGDYGSGRLLATSVLSVLALDDGRVLVGMVPPAVLERAALDPAAAPPP